MEEYISSLINSASFIGGRTFVPGPVEVPLRGTMISSSSLGPSFSESRHPLIPVSAGLQYQSASVTRNPNPSQPQQTASSVGMSENSSSILRADVSQMLAWLRSQSSQNMFSQTQALGTLPSTSTGSYEVAAPRIPKAYMELNATDCAEVVARAIRSIILHTCNDEFRQQVFAKLGVSSSHDVEREIKLRLVDLILQEEQQREQREQSNETDMEMNSEPSQASS